MALCGGNGRLSNSRVCWSTSAPPGSVDYDISVDGQRVLATEIVNIDDTPALEVDSPITVITNWPAMYGLDD